MLWDKQRCYTLRKEGKIDKHLLAPLKSTYIIKNWNSKIQVGIKNAPIKRVRVVYDNQTIRQIIPTVKTYYGICWEIAYTQKY